MNLRKLIYAGVSSDKDLDFSLRLQLANISAILGVISNIGFSILFLILDTKGKLILPIINTPFGILIGYSIYLNHIKKFTASRIILLISIPTVVLTTTFLFYGNLLGAHYFFLLFSMLPFIILPYSQKHYILIYFFINLFLFYYIGFVHNPPLLTPDSPFYNLEVRETFQKTSIGSCFTILALILFYFLRNTFRNQYELQRSILYKDRIFSILAHDLKGPIGSMGTFLSILMESWKKFSEEEIYQALKELQKNANQSYVVLENLLEWVKKDTNRFNFLPEHTYIKNIVKDAMELFQIQSSEKKIKWHIKINENHHAYVDERMMATIFRNLFSNAIKFSNMNGDIHIRSAMEDNRLIFEVEDFGKGIPPDKQNMILQGTQTKSEFGTLGERGTGIGLLVTAELLKVQNGSFKIESKMNFGTKIILSLPIDPEK